MVALANELEIAGNPITEKQKVEWTIGTLTEKIYADLDQEELKVKPTTHVVEEKGKPGSSKYLGGRKPQFKKKLNNKKKPNWKKLEKKEDQKNEEKKTISSRDDGNAMLKSINKSALQIKKPSHRKSSSPLNWFPRKKTNSFLERKIKLLQEVGGMNSTLDETLGDTNRHYSKVEREKIAARVAAHAAMEARRAAMVETSWCRILKAARIQSKDAELQLEKAEKDVEAAFNAASAVGVILYDMPDGPKRPNKIETETTGDRSTHTITASFETAFEVDKEVAAAVKMAFVRLASCPTWNQDDEFGVSRELLRKISQNPDLNEEIDDHRILSECESETCESEVETIAADFGCDHANTKFQNSETCESEVETIAADFGCDHANTKFQNSETRGGMRRELINMMLDRIKLLQEDELASLATIVATCGLNALLELENNKQQYSESYPNKAMSLEARKLMKRDSNYPVGHMKRKQDVSEIPSLENFLVKHVSRLEREMQEAKNMRKSVHQIKEMGSMKNVTANSNSIVTQDLGSILVKKHASRFEREIQDAKKAERALEQADKENIIVTNELLSPSDPGAVKMDRVNKPISRLEKAKLEALEENGLDKILIKRVPRLEREKMQALSSPGKDNWFPRDRKKGQESTDYESLDMVLVKHVSQLEKEKKSASICSAWEGAEVRSKQQHLQKSGQSLDEILVKPLSKLEKSNTGSGSGNSSAFAGMVMGSSLQVRREREMKEAWGGMSLGNSMRPHLSKLERDKVAWRRAEEEERRRKLSQED